MRLTMDVASRALDSAFTVEMLDDFARVDPSTIQVFTTFEDEPVPVGHCTRFWKEDEKLMAAIELNEGAYWPAPHLHPAELHAEAVVGFSSQAAPQFLAVVITSMPRGMLGKMLGDAFQAMRGMN